MQDTADRARTTQSQRRTPSAYRRPCTSVTAQILGDGLAGLRPEFGCGAYQGRACEYRGIVVVGTGVHHPTNPYTINAGSLRRPSLRGASLDALLDGAPVVGPTHFLWEASPDPFSEGSIAVSDVNRVERAGRFGWASKEASS